MPNAPSTLDTIRHLYVSGKTAEVLSVAESAWASHSSLATQGDQALLPLGEVMRIAALAARHDGDGASVSVWLARSRALFARAGSATGVALTMLVDLYDAIGEYGTGPTALTMLDAIECALGAENGPVSGPMAPSDVLALVAEKRAFVLLEKAQGVGGGPDLEAARREYQRALEIVGQDVRRRLKIEAALVSVDVLSGSIPPREGAIALERLLRDADCYRASVEDIAPRIQENVRRLHRDGRDLVSYETF